jgi:hypothetical protein
VAVPAPAARDPVRVRLEALLEADDAAPTTDELAEVAAAERVAAVLVEIVADERAPALVRNRGLAALGAFPSREGQALLERFASGAATDYARQAAARSLEAMQRSSPK